MPRTKPLGVSFARILGWVAVWSVVTTLVAGGLAYVVLERGGSFAEMLLAIGLVFGASMLGFAPRYLSALRSAGFSAGGIRSVTKTQWLVMIAAAITIAGEIALCDLAYARTQNRFLEALVPLLAMPPLMWFMAKTYRLLPNVKTKDAVLWRWNYRLQCALPIVFGANLVLQLIARHPDPAFEPFRNLLIAGYFVTISFGPVVVFFTRRRYLEASRARTA